MAAMTSLEPDLVFANVAMLRPPNQSPTSPPAKEVEAEHPGLPAVQRRSLEKIERASGTINFCLFRRGTTA